MGIAAVSSPQVLPLRSTDPHRIGPWQLVGRVGAGGMGTVFLGRDGETRAAVKVMSDALAEQPGFRERFAREIQALQRVQGPFAADVLGGDAGADLPWLATEYIPAPDLWRLVRDHGPLDSASWQGLAVGLITALACLHEAGVVHRDLKPSNILLAADGPRLIDFGIAQVAGATALTATGGAVGTPGWLAPEIVRGEDATAASDLFVAGSVLAFAATGRAPFGDTVPGAVMHAVLEREPDVAGASGYARILLVGLLAKEPDRRWDADRALEFLTGTGDRRAAGARATQMWQSSAAGSMLADHDIAVDPTRVQQWPPADAAPVREPAAPARRPAGRSALWAGIVTALLLMVPAAAVAGWWAIGGSDGRKSGSTGATRSSGGSAPERQLDSFPLIDSYPDTEAGRTAAAVMSGYLTAINDHDSARMCRTNVVAPCDELVAGTAQSKWSDVSIDEAQPWSASQISVRFSGTTTQPAAMGPDGDTCTDWGLNYILTRQGSDWRITDSNPSTHSPC